MGTAKANKIEKPKPRIFHVATFDVNHIEITADYFEIQSAESGGCADFYMENEFGDDILVASFRHWNHVIPQVTLPNLV